MTSGVRVNGLQSEDCRKTQNVAFCPALHAAPGSLVTPHGSAKAGTRLSTRTRATHGGRGEGLARTGL